MNNITFLLGKKYTVLFLLMVFLSSCNSPRQPLTPEQISGITKDVTQFTTDIQRGLLAKGPIAWLTYFDNSREFFMASEGQIVFHNYASAQSFIKDTLVKKINKVKLQWNHLRINPLSSKAAIIGSNFHEDLTSTSNQKNISVDGYFTGVAILTASGWKLRNLHWSIKPHN